MRRLWHEDEVAKRRGVKLARVALARKLGVVLHCNLGRRKDLPVTKTNPVIVWWPVVGQICSLGNRPRAQ
jgi:hypothetical protein